MKIRKSIKFQTMHICITITNGILWAVGWGIMVQLAVHFNWNEGNTLILPPILGMLLMTPTMLVLDYVDEFVCKGRDRARSWEKYHGFNKSLFYQVPEV